MNDLARNVIATGVGGAVGGGLSMLWGADSRIPASGMFAVATMTRPWSFIGALLAGSFATGITILLLKNQLTQMQKSSKKKKRKKRYLGMT